MPHRVRLSFNSDLQYAFLNDDKAGKAARLANFRQRQVTESLCTCLETLYHKQFAERFSIAPFQRFSVQCFTL